MWRVNQIVEKQFVWMSPLILAPGKSNPRLRKERSKVSKAMKNLPILLWPPSFQNQSNVPLYIQMHSRKSSNWSILLTKIGLRRDLSCVSYIQVAANWLRNNRGMISQRKWYLEHFCHPTLCCRYILVLIIFFLSTSHQ
jgi:hypothetical protein